MFIKEYWDIYIQCYEDLSDPGTDIGPLGNCYEHPDVAAIVAQIMKTPTSGRPDWSNYQWAANGSGIAWFDPSQIQNVALPVTGRGEESDRSRSGRGHSQATGSSNPFGSAAGAAVIASQLAHGARATSTVVQWTTEKSSVLPRVAMMIEMAPYMFVMMVAVCMVLAWAYGHGYLKVQFEVGNYGYKRENKPVKVDSKPDKNEDEPNADAIPPPPEPVAPRPERRTGSAPMPAKGRGKGKDSHFNSHRSVPTTARQTARPRAKAKMSAASSSSRTSSTRSGSSTVPVMRTRPLWVAPRTGQCYHRNEHCDGLRNASTISPMWRCTSCALRDTITGRERASASSLYAATDHDIFYHNSQHCNRLTDANRVVRYRACNVCADGRHLSSDTGGPPSPASAA